MPPLRSLFDNPALIFGFIFAISIFSLAAAFFAEAVLMLEPCILCIYQRYPFALAGLTALIGLIAFRRNPKNIKISLLICAVLFFSNSAIALYHTGVEQKWWVSQVEGCKVTFPDPDKKQSMLENIMSAPTSHCDEIPWQDPIIGLSMANYNVLLCFGMGLFCLVALNLFRPTRRSS